MANHKIDPVTKLNKGTSRDEWGNFNYWGYKTPDGKIRARVYAPNDEGMVLLEVKKFELPSTSWRRKVTFDDAIVIGSAYVKVDNTDKGFTSDEALRQVNALIEIHNDYFDKHVGRKIRMKGYDGTFRDEAHDVVGVRFSTDVNGELTAVLDHGGGSSKEDDVIDYTEDFAHNRVLAEFDAIQDEINEAQKFLDTLRQSYATSTKYEKQRGSYEDEGCLGYQKVNKLIALSNEFAKNTAPTEEPVT